MKKNLLALLLAVAAILPGFAAGEVPGPVESYGIPAPVSIRTGAVATHNRAGERIFLAYLGDARGCRTLFEVNLDTGKYRSIELPNASPSVDDRPFYLLLSSRNRLYSSYGGRYFEYDVESGKVLRHGRFSGHLTMGMTEDDKGVIWFVAYPGSQVASLDPETGKFTDYGSVYKQNWAQYQRYVAADDAGWLYFGIGNTAAQVLGFNPATREILEVLPPAERGKANTGEVRRDRNGKVYGWNRNDKNTAYYELHNGKATRLAAKPEITPPETKVIHGAQNLMHSDFGDGSKVLDLNLNERKLRYLDRDGKEKELSFDYQSGGSYLMGFAPLPDGTLRGGSFHPMRYFVFDTKKNEVIERGDAVHQWNIVTPVGDHLFVGAYAGGYVLDWNSAKPWSGVGKPGKDGNPRNLGAATPSIHRPHAIVATPDGNTVVMTGTPGYGRTGGGMVIYDRKSDRREVIVPEKLLSPLSINVMLPLSNREILCGMTVSPGTGGETIAKEATLGIFDLEKRQFVWNEAVIPGVKGYLGLYPLPGGKVLGAVVRDRLFVFDPATRKVEAVIPTGELGDLTVTQGPRIIFGDGERIFVLLRNGVGEFLPKEGKLRMLQKSPKPITAGGAAVNGWIYFCSNAELMGFRYK